MGIIKQLKQFLTGEDLFPITKTNAVYDNTLGRLDTLMQSMVTESEVLDNAIPELVRNIKNPFTGNPIAPVTRTRAIYNEDGSRLDRYLDALRGASSNNILINSNFANPVNQRGYISGTLIPPSAMFVLDRWRLNCSSHVTHTSLTLNNGYITIHALAGVLHNNFYQHVENPELYAGKTLTMSVKYRATNGGKACMSIFQNPIDSSANVDADSYIYKNLVCDGKWHTESLTFRVRDVIKVLAIRVCPNEFRFDASTGTYIWDPLNINTDLDVEWIKLEYGEVATPYTPKLYAEELMACKRYYKEVTGFTRVNSYSANTLTFTIGDFSDMRIIPKVAFKYNDESLLNTADNTSVMNLQGNVQTGLVYELFANTQSKTVRCFARKTDHGLTDATLLVSASNPICLDAELQ